jgi:hypothetical protein
MMLRLCPMTSLLVWTISEHSDPNCSDIVLPWSYTDQDQAWLIGCFAMVKGICCSLSVASRIPRQKSPSDINESFFFVNIHVASYGKVFAARSSH